MQVDIIHLLFMHLLVTGEAGANPRQLVRETLYTNDRLLICQKANTERRTIIHTHTHTYEQFTVARLFVVGLWKETKAHRRNPMQSW